MARASAAVKSRALLALARLLRENVEPLQTDNARDLDRAVANGLSAPMVDRLRLTPKVLETCAQGWEQLASRSEEHTSELQSQSNLVCRLLLEKKKKH